MSCVGWFLCWFLCVFFFFKQKTAYEMRISDWSSDVCSSDLSLRLAAPQREPRVRQQVVVAVAATVRALRSSCTPQGSATGMRTEIGRASCRERVCQYV